MEPTIHTSKEVQMDHFTTIEAVRPSTPGALSGFEVRCTCGFNFRTAFRTTAQADAADHVAFMATTARRIKYDLCDKCDMPRKDRHHAVGFKMQRTAYDIPGHKFVAS